jgi:hypothetical protein
MFDKNEIMIVVERAELARLFVQAAQSHQGKANVFREMAERMNVSGVTQSVGADVEEDVSYSNTIKKNVDASRKGLLDQAREHESKAEQKRFIASHLPEEPQMLSASVLAIWGLM